MCTDEELQKRALEKLQGAFVFTQLAIIDGSKESTWILSGATAALNGSAKIRIVCLGSFGIRALSQSLAREFRPHGIHVSSHVVIDGEDRVCARITSLVLTPLFGRAN